MLTEEQIKNNYNIFAQIDKSKYVCLIPKLGNSTIVNLSAKYLGINIYNKNESEEDFKYCHLNLGKYGYKWPMINNYIEYYADIKNKENYTFISIYRDPLERIISAYYSLISNVYPFESFLRALSNYNKNDLKKVDIHIRPQYMFYDHKIIDLYVDLKDLGTYIKSIGKEHVIINSRKNKEYDKEIFNKYSDKLKELYQDDINFINSIPENKKFKP